VLGPIPLLQRLPDQPNLRGYPAAGLLLAELLWGLVTGVLFPRIHRHQHEPGEPARLGIAMHETGGGGPDAGSAAAPILNALATLKEPPVPSSGQVREPLSKCPIK
jgi:hypothetical protein